MTGDGRSPLARLMGMQPEVPAYPGPEPVQPAWQAVDPSGGPSGVDPSSGLAVQMAALSLWIDRGNAFRDPEAITWGRLAKLSEEVGEVITAYVGATGQNPRKGVTHCQSDVRKELLDVAVTALAAYEHLSGNDGLSVDALGVHVAALVDRAGLAGVSR